MKNLLSEEEKESLKVQHKRERDKKICDRIKAVLLYDRGWTYMQIAEALLLSDDAIREHISEYKASQKLRPESGGSVEKLSSEQSRLLEEHLQKYTYLFTKDIIAYVKSAHGISYTVSGMRCWLKRHAFSYKKPAVVPGKANKEQQEQWIAEYEKSKQNLPENETICFMDGMHPTHNVQIAYGWIKKGVRKEIPTNSGRSRMNLSGIIDVLSKKVLVREDETLSAESTLLFLQKIEEAYPTKDRVHIFCDNARYYRNKKVKEYLKTSKITLHFLSPYSPNLNPIERLWKWMKERVLYNTYYEEFEDFKSAIMGFFQGLSFLDPISELGQAFASRIRDKFRPIGAPVPDF